MALRVVLIMSGRLALNVERPQRSANPTEAIVWRLPQELLRCALVKVRGLRHSGLMDADR